MDITTNIKKAGSRIRNSFRSKQYSTWEKENNKTLSKSTADGETTTGETSKYRARSSSTSAWSGEDDNMDTSTLANPGTPPAPSKVPFRRGSIMTRSMVDAVSVLRQRMKMQTRRSRLNVTTEAGTRRHTLGGRNAYLHSTLKTSSPRSGQPRVKTSLSVETPTKVRHEVESLTANMQALNTLTPNAVEVRTRKARTLTNGSLKTPKFSHRLVSQV